jgi:hypothetical protein
LLLLLLFLSVTLLPPPPPLLAGFQKDIAALEETADNHTAAGPLQ